MVLCHCHRVNDASVERVLQAGAPGLRGVVRATGAGTGCGGCLPRLRELCEAARRCEQHAPEVALAG